MSRPSARRDRGPGRSGRGPGGKGPRSQSRDAIREYEIEDDFSVFSRGLDKFIPSTVARWALSVSVETDKSTYGPDEPVEITVTISNRLPVPITVRIDNQRVWGWAVDGYVEAADEALYVPDRTRSLSLRAGESRMHNVTWNRRIKRVNERTRWEELSPGEYEISAFVSTTPRTEDTKTVSLR